MAQHGASPQIATQLRSLASADVLELAATLTASVPSEDEAIKAGIQRLLSSYLADGGDANRGRVTFEQNCATCHQVAGKGNSVGPNLDGIGNRGLERVVEDVLASNRNIDVAFHATTVLLESGRVITGLAKSTSDATLEIVDSQGKRHTVQRNTIDQQKVSRLSPMPANFHSTLPLQQQQDLVAYLLELTH